MKQIALILGLFLTCTTVFADENLPQLYTPNNINPYKSKPFTNLFNITNREPNVSPEHTKYDYMLSRIEREWLNKDYTGTPIGQRLDKLEEFVFGTSFNEDVTSRCDRLKRAFNAQKRSLRKNKSLFSGMPTSIPIGIDELVE